MTSTAEQQAQQQLDELSSSFAAWRAGKKHNKEKIPLDLLNQARQLGGDGAAEVMCDTSGNVGPTRRPRFDNLRAQIAAGHPSDGRPPTPNAPHILGERGE